MPGTYRRKTPPGALPDCCVRALACLVRAARRGKTLTIDELREELGHASLNALTRPLALLKAEGLVTQGEPGPGRNRVARTLRPACELFAAPWRKR